MQRDGSAEPCSLGSSKSSRRKRRADWGCPRNKWGLTEFRLEKAGEPVFT